jgi:hypothetical protein
LYPAAVAMPARRTGCEQRVDSPRTPPLISSHEHRQARQDDKPGESRMKTTTQRRAMIATFAAVLLVLLSSTAHAQFNREPGKSIGTVTTHGNLVVLTLNEDALGPKNFFDLDHRTLRFTPAGNGYRVEILPLRWDADFGSVMPNDRASLV